MPNYKPYPNEKNTPSRLTRKQERNRVFWYNKKLSKTLRKSQLAARRLALES